MINVTKTLKKHHKFIIVVLGLFLLMWLINGRSNRLEAFSLEEFEDQLSDDYEDDEDEEDEDDEQVTEENYEGFKQRFLNGEGPADQSTRGKMTREGKRVAGRLKDKVIDEYNNLCEYYNI
tara:strand:- start:436 stop:798 length:363 start_codon:yes stop_codon:yes gene_type:complete